MPGETQHSWGFLVGDGAGSEVFTQLEGMYEAPEWNPDNYTTRDATTIDVASTQNTKKYKFNAQRDGSEFTLTLEYMPGSTAQDRLAAQVGDNDGVNCQFKFTDASATTETHSFNALVVSKVIQATASNDSEGVDKVAYTLKVNSDVVVA